MLPFPILDSFIMFFIYGIIGWVIEVIYYGVTEGHFINRGFLNGPLCPVYGIGFYGVIWFFTPYVDNFPLLFFGSSLIATFVELCAGVLLYHTFHLRWWDYTEYRYNFHGYICVRFAIYWGIACSLGMYVLDPSVRWIIRHMNHMARLSTVVILCIILGIDIVVSVCTYIGFNKRVRFIGSISGGIRKTSDTIGSGIYNTIDTLMSKTLPAVETTQQNYSEFRELYAKHRAEEKELSARHRKEERELLASYVASGKVTIVKTRDAAGRKIANTWRAVRKADIRVLANIRTNRRDDNNEIIKYMKEHYDDSFAMEDTFIKQQGEPK